MKNSLKTLRIALACAAVFSVFSGNAQAENYAMTFSGNLTATACTIGLYTAAAGTSPAATFTVPDINLSTNTVFRDGGAGATVGSTSFYVKVPANCAAGTSGKYNVGFSAATLTGTRAANTAPTGPAGNVLFDLVSLSPASLGSMTLTVTPPATSAAATTQTGWGETLTNVVQSFNVRYYKTTTVATPVTAGAVLATITATGYYP